VDLKRPSPVNPSTPPAIAEPDWAQLAKDTLANADIDNVDVFPPPPEVIIINDDDNVSLPSSTKQTLEYLPKLEPDNTPSPPSSPVPRYPTRQRAPPKHLANFHLFTTVADNVQTSYPYVDARGNTVDLAFDDETLIAQVCHYVMLHCAETTFVGNPNN
jgi:hypothetical protein